MNTKWELKWADKFYTVESEEDYTRVDVRKQIAEDEEFTVFVPKDWANTRIFQFIEDFAKIT